MIGTPLHHPALVLVGLLGASLARGAPPAVDFDRDIRPILSDHCFACHGPDEKARKAKLRLDTRAGAFAPREDHALLVPTDPKGSELYRRITADDPDDLMPPRKNKNPLSPVQINLVRRWIESGADWAEHWAFRPPVRSALPTVEKAEWVRNPIDRFVLARLEARGWVPAVAAGKRRLIRRVTLDLTGLPPTPAEVATFLADQTSGAYERVVDRLLASPRYGERMAWDWLAVARYADTNGYQGDNERTMWPWRDWVIDAYNRNLSHDRFLTWQLAGDLLPRATTEQKLATGFCRNHMINGEGGRIAEENRVEYIFDQVETLGATWLGLTLTCARCHDHKYDPISQKNYYQLFDYFNQTPVNGGGGNPKTPPVLVVPPFDAQVRLADLQEQLDNVAVRMAKRRDSLAGEQAAWEQQRRADKRPAAAWATLIPSSLQAANGQTFKALKDGSFLVGGPNPANDTYTLTAPLPAGRLTGLRLDAVRHPTMTGGGIARSNSGNFVLTELEATVVVGSKTTPIKFTSAQATYSQRGYAVTGAIDGKRGTGWAVWQGKTIARDHAAVFSLQSPVDVPEGAGLRVVLRHDSPHKQHNLGRFRLSTTGRPKPDLKAGVDTLTKLLLIPPDRRTPAQADQVARAFLATDKAYQSLAKESAQLEGEKAKVNKSGVTVMVMADAPKRRTTHILQTGSYSQRRDAVTAGVPEVLPPMPQDAKPNRLALARWLTDPTHPLTARVVVNRNWQKFFGTGLVKTTEDFGSQGEKPSHPLLLDWMAVSFVEGGWNIKALHKQIVTSATYRQTAQVAADGIARDPDNRQLARGPRYRLPSWMLRDQALVLGGLLIDRRGGAAVSPYQPAGIWAEATFGKKRYKPDTGDRLYRRSLYVYWRRIVGPTMFFDVAKRQTCEVKTARTNTPLHALLTLNETAHVESARTMAQRLVQMGGDDASRATAAFEMATARPPSSAERTILVERLGKLRKQYAIDRKAAEALTTVGAAPRDPNMDLVELAAHTGLCSLILNLDETLSK